MYPLTLTLKNFIGIRSGLGRDEITLDLGVIDGSLVALVGKNGCGKSTIIDNLHPYRIMPSRASGYSPGSFSYYDHTYGDAAKFLVWEHDGAVYESSILIRGTNKTKKQECYLHRRAAGGLEPVILPDGTESDGKAETYDRCVENILGSPQLYFTAAFACQGRKTLADYQNSDIKSLLSDLLGLDSIKETGLRAYEVARAARSQLAGIHHTVAGASRLREGMEAVQAKIFIANKEMEYLERRRDSAKMNAADARRRLNEAEALHAEQAQTERRRETLLAQLRTVDNRLNADIVAIRANAAAAGGGYRHALAGMRAESDRIAKEIVKAEHAISQATDILGCREEIEREGNAITALEARRQDQRAIVEGLERSGERLREYEKEVASSRQSLDRIARDEKEKGKICDGLLAKAWLIEAVPCRGTDLQGRCSLLSDAVQAAANLPSHQEEMKSLRAWREEAQKKWADAVEKTAPLSDAYSAINEARRVLAELDEGIRRRAAAHTAQSHALATASTTLKHAQNMLSDLHASAASIDMAPAQQALEEVEVRTNQAIRDAESLADAERSSIQAEIAALPPTDMDGLVAARTAAAAADKELDDIATRREASVAEIARLEGVQAGIQRELDSVSDDIRRQEALENEIAQWSLLAKACGNDGIIALCIDDAGPSITSVANDLLTACYGPRFTLAIETQARTAKGDFKESFDIRVFDAERGDTKSVGDVSGGERIWLNESMTRAIALYQAENSGRRYECLFSDESDGALDPDKKRQFLRMKRKVLELGGYRREIFISHTEELWNTADAVIQVSDLP